MKRVSAVICELNPLHGGHEYIFNKARTESDCLVAVMSGNFVQRGECALFDKYERARHALMCGANLVVELPFPWCAAPAEFFARAGVHIACSLGADRIVFGSECGDIEKLKRSASLVSSPEFDAATESLYVGGAGYAAARETAARALSPELADVFSSSNDMLAVEYIKSAAALGYDIDFEAVKRQEGAGYMSAGEIREKLRSDPKGAFDTVPEKLVPLYRSLIENGGTAFAESLFETEYTVFRLASEKNGSLDSESGLVRRLAACAGKASDGAQMMRLAATKKYTDARIKRAALFAVLGINKEKLCSLPRAAYVLGADANGRELLGGIRKKESFSLVTKPSSAAEICFSALAENEEADRLYTMLLSKRREKGYFLKQKPVIF